METIGLIGGMSWESSLEYYRIINEYVNEKLGCTEIPFLVKQEDTAISLFDTTETHAKAAASFILS